MPSINAWYLGIIVSTERGFAISLNFLFKVRGMRSLREACVLLCITEHSHLPSLHLYRIPVPTQVMHTAGAKSQTLLLCLHPSRCLAIIFIHEHLPLDKEKIFWTLKCCGHQKGQRSQCYTLHSFLGLWGNPVLLCPAWGKAEMLVQRPKKAELTAASGQSGRHRNRAAGVALILSYSAAKAQFLSLLIFFRVNHASSRLLVCLFWGRKATTFLMASDTGITHHKWELLVIRLERELLREEGREEGLQRWGRSTAWWLPLGPSRPLHKLLRSL